MRIRNFRREDIPILTQIQIAAARVDGTEIIDEKQMMDWLLASETNARDNAFVVTDDDDVLQTWGQAGTLEGVEGEIVGYTCIQLIRDNDGYHFRCRGTVHPQQRCRHAGWSLFICAINRAHHMASDFIFEALRSGIPIYFEALLPKEDGAAIRLAQRCEMDVVEDEAVPQGLRLYRREL